MSKHSLHDKYCTANWVVATINICVALPLCYFGLWWVAPLLILNAVLFMLIDYSMWEKENE